MRFLALSWPVRLSARTLGFHPSKSGSTPLRAISKYGGIMVSGEGTIQIDIEEIYDYLEKSGALKMHVERGHLYILGVPRFNRDTKQLEIDYAFDSSVEPASWHPKPKAATQWEESSGS